MKSGLARALIQMNSDAWDKRDLDAAYDIYADDVVFHRAPFPPMVGKEANMQADAGMLAAFTETRSTIDEIVVEGNTAAMRWTWQAVHTGISPSLGIPLQVSVSGLWDAVSIGSDTTRS